MKKIMGIAAAAAVLLSAGAAQAEGDAAAGERVFKRCMACHTVGEGAANKVGPHLNGIVGREAGSVADYAYGDALAAKAAEIGAWDVEELMAYLQDPGKFIGGRTKMTMKFPKEADRANVIAYLMQFNADGTTK